MRWISALCNLISATMQPYVTVFLLGTLTLGMKKMVLFPFGMRIPTPWAIMNVSLANSVTHVFTYSPRRNCFYSYNIPVMGSITSLASKWIHASCYVRICVAREYLGVVQPILGCCCSFWYFRVSTTVGCCSAIIVNLGDGAVTGPVDGTLGYGAVMGPGNGTLGVGSVIGAIVGRYVASILCRVLMACNCSPSIDNGNAGSRFMRSSVKSSTAWCAA